MLQKKPSVLKREHPALQNMNFLNFFYICGSFCPRESGSTDPIESGSSSDRICNRAFSRALGYQHRQKCNKTFHRAASTSSQLTPIRAWMNIVIFLRIGMQIALQKYIKFKYTSLTVDVDLQHYTCTTYVSVQQM